MPRNYSSEITHSLYGRDLGVEYRTSGQSGSTQGRQALLSGPDAYRVGVSTAETTGVQLHPFGISMLTTGTSQVYVLNPPIPGVEKIIVSSAASNLYVKTRNGESLESTYGGSSMNTMTFTSYSFVVLRGLTTARWLVTGMPLTSASLDFSTTT